MLDYSQQKGTGPYRVNTEIEYEKHIDIKEEAKMLLSPDDAISASVKFVD